VIFVLALAGRQALARRAAVEPTDGGEDPTAPTEASAAAIRSK